MSKGTFVDLFAGIGGFHYALSRLKMKCVLAVEKDEDCRKIYLENHKIEEKSLVEDIRDLTRDNPDDIRTEREAGKIRDYIMDEYEVEPGVDFLCGGFPCQPFSKSGSQKGAEDEIRGTLFKDIILLIHALEPKYVILENVRNLAGPRHEKTLERIWERLDNAGYHVVRTPVILSPHKLKPRIQKGLLGGAPQARERVFILAHRKGLHDPSHLVELTRKTNKIGRGKPHDWSISEILGDKRANEYLVTGLDKELLEFWEKFLTDFPKDEHLPGHPIWTQSFRKTPPKSPKWKRDFVRLNNILYKSHQELFDAEWMAKMDKFAASRRKFEWQASQIHPIGERRTLRDLAIQLRPSGVRVKPATYLPALVAINQTSIIGPDVKGNVTKKFRRITPKEAAKLQGMTRIKFGKQHDSISYKQLGNAVNVGVVEFLAKLLMDEAAVEALSPVPPDNAKQRGKRGKPGKRRAIGRAKAQQSRKAR